MAHRIRNLYGLKFGELTVGRRVPKLRRRGELYWYCTCSCGQSVMVRSSMLTRGCKRICNINGHDWYAVYGVKPLHDKHKSEYRLWRWLKIVDKRRRIRFYKPWREDFREFFKGVGPRPHPDFKLCRIDLTRGYRPKNVEWRVSNRGRPCKGATPRGSHVGVIEKLHARDQCDAQVTTAFVTSSPRVLHAQLLEAAPLSSSVRSPVAPRLPSLRTGITGGARGGMGGGWSTGSGVDDDVG